MVDWNRLALRLKRLGKHVRRGEDIKRPRLSGRLLEKAAEMAEASALERASRGGLSAEELMRRVLQTCALATFHDDYLLSSLYLGAIARDLSPRP